MERPLYRPRARLTLDSSGASDSEGEIDVSQLFEQIYVDPARLARGVQLALRERQQIGLGQLLEDRPLEQGLAELVTYLSLTDPAFDVVFDEEAREQVRYSRDGGVKVATVPRVTFARRGTALIGGGRP
jgi:hypothetical protein